MICNSLLLMIIISMIREGVPIKCYSCITTENPACEDPYYYDMERTSCDSGTLAETRRFAEVLGESFAKLYDVHLLENAIPLNCVKQVTRVRGEEVILRGCQLPKEYKIDVCKKVLAEPRNKDGIEVKHCSLCEIDGCNGGDSSVANNVMIAVPIVIDIMSRICRL